MSIAASDIIIYGSLNRPENDTTTSGGAIDVVNRAVFTEFTGNQTIRIRSDGVDTRIVTIEGRNAGGAVRTELLTLDGTNNVNGTQIFNYLLKVTVGSSSASRTITVETNEATPQAVGAIPPNEVGFFRVFLKSASEAGAVNRYEKLFAKNNHATLTLNDADITLTADPNSKIKIALAAAKDDNVSVINRKTSPGLVFSDDNVVLSVPGGTLEAGSAIGIWVEQALGAGDAAIKSSFTARVRGTST